MSDLRLPPAEPVPAAPEPGDARAPGPPAGALDLAWEWSGGALALVMGGSHATGEAVWATVEGRRLCLSDLDLYAVVPGPGARRRAEARARAGRAGLRERLLELGLAAPLEVAFLAPLDIERLPARPGTIELRRHGRVVRGDPSWLARVPAWDARDVSGEEVRLLHENRAFELLLARPALSAPRPLARLQARHAVLKCALDVARVEALRAGAYPDGARALAAWARAERRTGGLEGVLEAALAWRAGRVDAPGGPEALAEWRAVACVWLATWHALFGPGAAAALAAAGRARLRRRVRLALTERPRSGRGPGVPGRLTRALRGTPQHRLNAAAALLLEAAAAAPAGDEPRLERAAARLLTGLGFGREARAGWPGAARSVCGTWDRWVLDGQRTGEPA